MLVMIPRAAVAGDRIGEVLQTSSSVVPPEDGITEVSVHGRLEFADVGFTYAGADYPVLCDISFSARPGQTTAVIGSTGAGKSTLLGLLAGLDALGIDEHLCCPDGGALALGHPWGASGAVVVVRLFSRLVRQRQVEESRPYGLAAVAAGGGQGQAGFGKGRLD